MLYNVKKNTDKYFDKIVINCKMSLKNITIPQKKMNLLLVNALHVLKFYSYSNVSICTVDRK